LSQLQTTRTKSAFFSKLNNKLFIKESKHTWTGMHTDTIRERTKTGTVHKEAAIIYLIIF
jgi:hypothetical protein